jgi:hypothetical protein
LVLGYKDGLGWSSPCDGLSHLHVHDLFVRGVDLWYCWISVMLLVYKEDLWGCQGRLRSCGNNVVLLASGVKFLSAPCLKLFNGIFIDMILDSRQIVDSDYISTL